MRNKKIFYIFKIAISFCPGAILLYIFCLTLGAALSFFINILNKEIINTIQLDIQNGFLSNTFITLLIIYAVLYFIHKSGSFINTLGFNYYRYKTDALFQKIFMWKTSTLEHELFLKNDFLDKFAFISSNTSKISTCISHSLSLIFSHFFTLFGSIVLFIENEPLLLIYVAIVAGFAVPVNKFFSKKEYELEQKQVNEKRYHNYYKELLTGKGYAKELRIYSLQKLFYTKWYNFFSALKKEQLSLSLKKIMLQHGYSLFRVALRLLSTFFLLIGLYYGKYDLGVFCLLFGLVETSTNQINAVVGAVLSGAYREMHYLVNYYDFIGYLPQKKIQNILDSQTKKSTDLQLGPFENLVLKDVSYTYPNANSSAIKNLSLTIEKGEVISILGYNGSGKTTLSKILCGLLIPQTGTASINGIQITTDNQQEVCQYFGIAPQDFSKFSISFREFISLRDISKSRDSAYMNTIYKQHNLTEFFGKYQNGEESILGKIYEDNGVDLSRGEWQNLITIAAQFGAPEIIMLDEPSASIDPIKEVELIDKLKNSLTGKTAILISHRIAFARIAKKIVIMQNGEIAECGSHEELIHQKGVYWKLFTEQKKLYEDNYLNEGL